jgi:ketosteroid isomerase-like protein
MSQESTTPDLVELTRRAFEASSRGDVDTVMSFIAPDACWEVVDLGVFEGVTAIRGFLEDWFASYEEYVTEPKEVLSLGNGVVFAITQQNGRLAGSTMVREVWAYRFLWLDGMLVRISSYPDIEEARGAAERLAEERG